MLIYNSLSGQKEVFTPLNPKKVTLYVCGITPYDTTHLGHAFTYIFYDVLVKYLSHKGFEVVYTQNITDINDRDNDILKRAKEQNIPWTKLAQFWTDHFLADMKALNWTKPNYYLKASEQIANMVFLIKKLLINNLAYQKNGSVYLEVSKIKDYGKLSKLTREQMLVVANNFEEDTQNPDKKDPLDITLWRASSANQPKHIPSFDSIFGKGRPGWHIECSAMSIFSLGEQIDIHGGGIDLIYPHHEAEIAQSEGATKKTPFVKYWVHTAPVSFKGEKMSKSLGNLVMVSDLLKKYSPNVIRWVLLSHHYRQAWEFQENELEQARENLQIIKKSVIKTGQVTSKETRQFESLMEDDFDTPKALDLILNIASQNNSNVAALMKILGFPD